MKLNIDFSDIGKINKRGSANKAIKRYCNSEMKVIFDELFGLINEVISKIIGISSSIQRINDTELLIQLESGEKFKIVFEDVIINSKLVVYKIEDTVYENEVNKFIFCSEPDIKIIVNKIGQNLNIPNTVNKFKNSLKEIRKF